MKKAFLGLLLISGFAIAGDKADFVIDDGDTGYIQYWKIVNCNAKDNQVAVKMFGFKEHNGAKLEKSNYSVKLKELKKDLHADGADNNAAAVKYFKLCKKNG